MFLTSQVTAQETKNRGKGVFANAEIAPGTLIADYLGIVTESDAGAEYENDSVYDMWYSDLVDLCPDPKEDGAHLINTSCEPNCGMTALGRHTVIFAIRKIFPGEELTYDYFLGEQDEDCVPGSDNCLCGSPFCRGTMYSHPAAYAAWEKYLEKIMGDTPEEPPVPYGQKLPPLEHYPESIQDDPIYPVWGTRRQEPLVSEASLLRDPIALRSAMRASGRQLAFPDVNIVVEGILYDGHLACRHLITN